MKTKTIFECISGSHAYGTNVEGSDIDKRGVFMLSNMDMLRMHYHGQTGDKKQDIVHYELRRFFELLENANPNVIEFLFMPRESTLHSTLAWAEILFKREIFITQKLKNSFGGYAIAQIKKARGMNKMIVNPVDKVRKTPADFCTVIDDERSSSMKEFIELGGFDPEKMGLAKVPNAKGIYHMRYDFDGTRGYRGLCVDDSNTLRCSSLAKRDEKTMRGYTIFYNQDAYTQHCKDYKKYWEWIENRNPVRYSNTESHGKGYDGKNMMHCRRLLDMALELAEAGMVRVKRPDAKKLIRIREGKMEYKQLLHEAERDIADLDDAFAKSGLPKSVKREDVDNLILDIRDKYGDF